jgi:Tfp pilus assembly protein PilP
MKLTTGILILGMAAGAWAQNLDEVGNVRDTMRNVQQKKQNDSDAALAAGQSSGQSSAQSASPTRTVSISGGQMGSTGHSKSKSKSKSKIVAVPRSHRLRQTVAVEGKAQPAEDKPRAINLTDRRDPFVSPVVNRAMVGSGCSTGKRCLAIDQIALKGVVRSDAGMIAVVVNALEKAYFLRENDPVFNGYVVRITGDSIIFKETVQDKLGKPFTREVTKKITTPAV